MSQPELPLWESRFEEFVGQDCADAAHGLCHIRRVVAAARELAAPEDARREAVIPAAWLHDCVALPKDDPRRERASSISARKAGEFLRGCGYPEAEIPEIEHAIEAHSFSAGLEPLTPEAKVVRDADRLDALGAVGIARALMLGGTMGRELYDPREPFPQIREPDDGAYVLDHFYTKLLGLAEKIKTAAGREEARRRTEFMREYLRQLGRDLGGPRPDW